MADTKSDPLKAAMLQYAPALSADYEAFLRRLFAQMQADLGPALVGVYRSHRWARTFGSSGLRSAVDHKRPAGSLSFRDLDTVPYTINEERLESLSKHYGEDTALMWYNKMHSKLGALDGVSVSSPGVDGMITISGHHGDNKVVVLQQRIINQSSTGTLFHQFPARIYVNDKFQSEAAYQKTIQGWGMAVAEKKPVTQMQCNKCGYVGVISEFRFDPKYYIKRRYCPACESESVSRVVADKKLEVVLDTPEPEERVGAVQAVRSVGVKGRRKKSVSPSGLHGLRS